MGQTKTREASKLENSGSEMPPKFIGRDCDAVMGLSLAKPRMGSQYDVRQALACRSSSDKLTLAGHLFRAVLAPLRHVAIDFSHVCAYRARANKADFSRAS